MVFYGVPFRLLFAVELESEAASSVRASIGRCLSFYPLAGFLACARHADRREKIRLHGEVLR